MYSSPTTPSGAGRSHRSSTNSAARGTGEPIGADPAPVCSGALIAAYTVASVGPYALIITRPGAHRSTTSTGQASPATTNAVVSKPSGDSIPTAEGVWHKTLTFSVISNAWKSSGELTDSGTTTSRPPCSSAPKISHTDTSKTNECHCDHTSPGPTGKPACNDSNSCDTL